MAEEVVRIRFETTGSQKAVAQTRAIGTAAKSSSAHVSVLGKKGKTAGAELKGAFVGAVNPVTQLKSAFLGLGVALGVRQILQTIDLYQTLRNRIKLVTSSQAEANQVFGQIKKISLASNTSLESTTVIFQRTSQAAKQLGKTQQDALDLTASISDAVKISGVSATAANAGLIQFSQGLASGRLGGEELRSVLEQLPRLAMAIADGLDVPLGKLREMGSTGKLAPEDLFRALKDQAAILKAEAATMEVTLSQAFENIKTEFVSFIGGFSEAIGASTAMSSALLLLADNIAPLLSMLIGFAAAWVIAKTAMLGYAGAVIIVKNAQKGFALLLAATRTLVLGYAIAMRTMTISQFLFATATAAASGALKLFRLALASTGIGAIVVLLGLAIGWLINFGMTSDKISGETVTGWEKIKVAMSVVGDFFRPLLSALGELFTGWSLGWGDIVSFATTSVDMILRAASAAGRAIAAIASGNPLDAWSAAKSAFTDTEGPLESLMSGGSKAYQSKLAEYLKNRPSSDVDLNAPLGKKPPPKVSKAGVKKAKAVADAIADMGRERAALQELVDAHGQSQFAIQRLISVREAEDKIRDLGIKKSSEQAETIRNEADAIQRLGVIKEANSALGELQREKAALIELAGAQNMSAIAVQKLTAAREQENKIADIGLEAIGTKAAELREAAAENENLRIAKDAAGEIRTEFESIVPSFGPQSAALESWASDTKAALIAAGNGWEVYAEQVDVVLHERLKAAYMKNLEMSETMAAGVQRSLLKIAEENADVASMTEDIVKDAFKGMEDALVEFTKTGKLSFGDMADSIVEDINRMIIKSQITGPLAKMIAGGDGAETGSGSGGLIGSLMGFLSGGSSGGVTGMKSSDHMGDLGGPSNSGGSSGGGFGSMIGSLFSGGGGGGGGDLMSSIMGMFSGAANGANFTVGGSGGTDSQLVAFKATPGETVDVRTPGQQGGGMTVVNNFTIHAPSGTIPRETQAQISARVGAQTRRAMSRNN